MNQPKTELFECAQGILNKKEMAVLLFKYENPEKEKNRLEIAQHFRVTPYRADQILKSIDAKLSTLV